MFVSAVLAATLALAGCETAPYGNGGYSRPSQPAYGYDNRGPVRCSSCGVVKEVQQVYVERKSNGTLGAVIGAVMKAMKAPVVKLVDGSSKVATANGGSDVAWRVTVRLDSGEYTTVTQAEDPRVREGDYVEIQGGRIYAR